MKFGLKGKIISIILLVTGISLIGITYNLNKLSQFNDVIEKLFDHQLAIVMNVLEAERNIFVIHRDMKDIALSQSIQEIESKEILINNIQKDTFENLRVTEERFLREEGKDKTKKAQKIFAEWEPIRKEVISLSKEGRKADAALITQTKGDEQVKQIIDAMDALRTFAYSLAIDFRNEASHDRSQAYWISFFIALGSVAISILIGLFFAGSLINPIVAAVQKLSTTSSEIMVSIQEQAASTRQQATSIQETTPTMEEMSRTGSQILEKARSVAQSAEATSTAGVSGIQAVNESSETMDSIKEQVEQVAENIVRLSEKTQAIGDIIVTVTDIAERSNLLALNATIEAVGAGEQGERFSVVANEMKNLADQAKESTVQIRSILGDIQKEINNSVMSTEESVKRVEMGKKKSQLSAETIEQLIQTTQTSIQAFQQIVAGTNQQQIGIEQITEVLKNIRIATEQTAAGITQIERAVVDLNDLGTNLRQLGEPAKR